MFCFVALWEALRLCSSCVWDEGEDLRLERFGLKGREILAVRGGAVPRSSDSGTIRRPIGSLLVVVCPWPGDLGRPLAAAAQESRVVRLALRAAS